MTEDVAEETEKCPTCDAAILGGFVLDVCDMGAEFSLDDKAEGLSCLTLRGMYERDEITPTELVKEIRGRVGPDHQKTIDEIVDAAREEGVDIGDLEDEA